MFHSKIGKISIPLAVVMMATLFYSADTAAQIAPPLKTKPVLMVIANQDFHHPEYAVTRAALEAQGLRVVVGAATTEPAIPQGSSPRHSTTVNMAFTDGSVRNYSAVVFVGGWGSSMYQYSFEGTYHNSAYQLSADVLEDTNNLIGDFFLAGKPVVGIAQGVSVLAWARVDGESPLKGRMVVGDAGGIPAFRLDDVEYPDAEVSARWHAESNGATMLTSRSLGDPMSSADDVYVDGNIITAENYDSASLLAKVIAKAIASGQY